MTFRSRLLRTSGARLGLALLALLPAGGLMSARTAEAASDPRFFGLYCGSHGEEVTVRITGPFRAVTWRTLRARFLGSARARIDYTEGPGRNGLLHGEGEVRIDRVEGSRRIINEVGLEEGDTFPLALGGVVVDRGAAEGSATIAGIGTNSGAARLLDDGETLRIQGADREITLSKARCGNAAPTANIIRPVARRIEVPWGSRVEFQGTASDPDGTLSDDRLVWSLGALELGTGSLIETRALWSPSTHTVTFSATDDGGRIATDTITVDIVNNPPSTPVIRVPDDGATFYVGQRIPLHGYARDRDDGPLTGDALIWQTEDNPRLGTGRLLRTTLPKGDHTVTLRAVDSDGASSSTSVRIHVRRPAPGENLPPVVAIVAPEQPYLAIADTDCLTLVAEALDAEDGMLRGSAVSWEDRYVDGGVERTRSFTGDRIEVCDWPAGVYDTPHVVSVTATDSGGRRSPASDFIRLFIIPGGLI